jgi:hypothetical protein
VRLDIGIDRVVVTLSERNLRTLMHHLALAPKNTPILSQNVYAAEQPVRGFWLVVRAEDDAAHYGKRGFPPGAMSAEAEQALAESQGAAYLEPLDDRELDALLEAALATDRNGDESHRDEGGRR